MGDVSRVTRPILGGLKCCLVYLKGEEQGDESLSLVSDW
jgi:hypothetical protein